MGSRSYLVQSAHVPRATPEEYLYFYVDGWSVTFSIQAKTSNGQQSAEVYLTRQDAKEFACRLTAAIAEYEVAAAAKYQRAKERRQQRKQKEQVA